METLIISKEDFVGLLQKQVDKGREMLQVDVPLLSSGLNRFGRTKIFYRENEESNFRAAYKKWNDYNKEIYKQSFSSQHNSYLDSYVAHEHTLWGLDIIKELKEIIVAMITQMEGDIEKCALIPCKVSSAAHSVSAQNSSKDVFIVHGHDDAALKDVENFVRKVGFDPIILRDMPSTGKTVIEKIEKYTGGVCFAIVLYTPCDEGKAKEDPIYKSRARQNVLFEHGYLCAKLTRSRVCALVKEDVEEPSDLAGIVFVRMNEKWEFDVVREMKAIGLNVDLEKLF